MVGWQWPACPDAHHIRQPCDASVRCKTERRRSKLQIEPSRTVATRSPAQPLHLCSDPRPFRAARPLTLATLITLSDFAEHVDAAFLPYAPNVASTATAIGALLQHLPNPGRIDRNTIVE